jgi:hypothetical protein
VQRRLPLIAAAVIVFVAVAVLLARFLSVEGQERDAVAALLKQRTHGPVKIIRLDSETAYSIGTDEGWSRVVWAPTAQAEPIVQCIRVRRDGGPLTARTVKLLSLRPPLSNNEGSC